jgi:MFS family permease
MTFTLAYGLFAGFAAGFVMFNLPPVLDQFLVLYQTSYGFISILLSALFWSHAAVQVPGGMIVDRTGIRRSTAISLACLLAGSLVPAIGPYYSLGLIGRVIAGFGTGLTFITHMKMIALNAPARVVGLFQSIFGGVFVLGSILSFFILPRAGAVGWRMVFLSTALPVVIGLVLLPFIHLKPDTAGVIRPMRLARVLAVPSVWIVALLHSLSYGSVILLGYWMTSVVAELSPGGKASDFSRVGMLMLLISGAGRMVSGLLLFKFRIWPIVWVTTTIIALLYAVLTFNTSPAVAVVLAAVVACFGSINFGALWQMATRLSDQASLGTVLGSVNFLANAGIVLYTMMFGWYKDLTGTFLWAFATLAGLAVIALILGDRAFGRHAARGQEAPAS